MSVKIYGSVVSTCTQRVLFLLEELQEPYDLVPIDMMKGEHLAADYVKERHPFGRIPSLEDTETRLYESRAICRYLVAKYAGTMSLPTTASELGIFEQAASVDYSYFDPAVTNLAYEKLFKKFMGRGEPDEALVQKHEATLYRCLDLYEKTLSQSDYIVGKRFSLVDVFLAPWINFLPRLGYAHEITSRPSLERWWANISSRPSWQRVNDKIAH